jgi:hypothetical protein
MKKVQLTESEFRKVIHESIGKLIEQPSFSVEPHISEIPRETNIRGIFGRYEPEVSDDVIRYMRKNPRLIIKRLIDIYGEKFFTMVDREEETWVSTQGPLDEQVDDEFDYDPEVEKRKDINNYIKYMVPVVRGDEEFDDMHMIEIDFFHYDRSLVTLQVDLTFEIPNTNNPKFDRIVAREAVKFLLNKANDGMDKNEMNIISIKLK